MKEEKKYCNCVTPRTLWSNRSFCHRCMLGLKKDDETNTAWHGVDADKFVDDLRSGELNLTKEKP